MKSFCQSAVLAIAFLVGASPALAQAKPQIINIPLSRPGEAMSMDIDVLSAHIEVIGEDREDAIFEITIEEGQRKIVTPSGTKTLTNSGYELEVDERDNHISFDTDWRNNRISVIARIPRRADLELDTVENGEIIVRNISGNLQLSNVNGPITASGISGSVIAETVNDGIEIGFVAIDETNASSLETVNGDVTISMPANQGAQIHLDTAQGEIFSDFEVDVQANEPTVVRDDDDGGTEIRIESVIIANINGGGPIIRMNTLNGDINIRKNP